MVVVKHSTESGSLEYYIGRSLELIAEFSGLRKDSFDFVPREEQDVIPKDRLEKAMDRLQNGEQKVVCVWGTVN